MVKNSTIEATQGRNPNPKPPKGGETVVVGEAMAVASEGAGSDRRQR